MHKTTLHITNGDSLTEKLNEIQLIGDIVVWREMLCEGPCLKEVGSPQFIDLRKDFLDQYYNIPPADYDEKFVIQLKKLQSVDAYDEVVLWFEFDLFCHINMLAAIQLLEQLKYTKPIFLVCSGRVTGEKELKGLSELDNKQLQQHYDNKMLLTPQDIATAQGIWFLYCGNNPKKLKSEIKKSSNFNYLSSCIRAHIERYPNAFSGINTLEKNILKLIATHQIKSKNQWCAYVLNYQGYYGFGDMQIFNLLDKLEYFIDTSGTYYKLTSDGEAAITETKNFYQIMKSDIAMGGTKKYDFLYNPKSHKLLKL